MRGWLRLALHSDAADHRYPPRIVAAQGLDLAKWLRRSLITLGAIELLLRSLVNEADHDVRSFCRWVSVVLPPVTTDW